MTKIGFFTISLCIFDPVSASGQWLDEFESYAANSFPSVSWTSDGNASSEPQTNFVDETIAASGSKSLRLYGAIGGCWAAIAYRPLTVSPPFEVEAIVRNGNESLSGCNPYRSKVGLRKGTSWLNPARGLIIVMANGDIKDANDDVIASEANLTWYTVRVRYERPSPTQVIISYWVNGVYKHSTTLPVLAEEDQMTNLELSVLEGTAWFDNVGVVPIEYAFSTEWQEGFETYIDNTFPSVAWVPDGNASSEPQTNSVDGTIAASGSKSLRLYGTIGGCWAAIAYRPLTVSPPFEIEAMVRNGNESLSGCNPFRAKIGLREGTSWLNPARGLIIVTANGDIKDAADGVLASEANLAWYSIRIRYERPSPTQTRISYWINGVYKYSTTLPVLAEEDQMTNLELSVLEGTAWFDNVSVNTVVVTDVLDEISSGPSDFNLLQNFPNPFNPSTTISYTIPFRSVVRLQIVDVLGRTTANLLDGEVSAGYHQTTWNSNVASGIYFYRIEAVAVGNPSARFVSVKKMILVR